MGDYHWRLEVSVPRNDEREIVHTETRPTTVIFEDEIKSIHVASSAIAPAMSPRRPLWSIPLRKPAS